MTPRRVVFDSNVFISAFLFGGMPRSALASAIDGAVVCIMSVPLLDEIRDVLQRPKFGLSVDQALAFVEEIHALSLVVRPPRRLRVIAADADDNRVLECALAGKADTIVSGDAHVLALRAWRGIRVLAPSAFVAEMKDRPTP